MCVCPPANIRVRFLVIERTREGGGIRKHNTHTHTHKCARTQRENKFMLKRFGWEENDCVHVK